MNSKRKKPYLLCVMDGVGLNPDSRGNAVQAAKKPHLDRLFSHYAWTTLTTHGEAVGLPEGQMGNSEVGHLNIGAGRVVEQWLLRISRALAGNFLDTSESYRRFVRASERAPAIHLIGLYSDGGVHSHSDHLHLLIERLLVDTRCELVVHLITDGRDTSPHRAGQQVEEFIRLIQSKPRVRVGSLVGRFFAMDRDKRWDRTGKAYEAIVLGKAERGENPLEHIRNSYAKGITDEFLEPLIVSGNGIGADDCVMFWNFREDRMRQIVAALCMSSFDGFQRERPLLNVEQVLGFTEYDHTFHLPALFEPLTVPNHLGEYLSSLGRTQLRVAETEKYPHVTYFFNGGVELPYAGEVRTLVPSPRDVKTYDLKPEMSALEVTAVVVEAIRSGTYDLIVVNLANGDMVGHTGVFEAAVRAVETVDRCIGGMVSELEAQQGEGVILADHGNAEQMVHYTDGTPYTSHTTFPVPLIVLSQQRGGSLKHGGALCDVAPTLLELMHLPIPAEMSGRSLLSSG